VDDQLQRLLEAEARAQGIIDAASRQRQQLIDEALAAAREAEARFEAGRNDLRAPFLHEAANRAEQAVAELARRYGERQRTLRELASLHEAAAVEAALSLLLDPNV
jgi:vacuolar-type H+-ATPase subunit H